MHALQQLFDAAKLTRHCTQMMQNLLLQEGDIVKFKSTSLPKGTYVKLRPQSKDFLDISNPKAVCVPHAPHARHAHGVAPHLMPPACRLETTLRRYSCLTTGDSILINYNNKRYFIDIFETKPQRAVTIIEARARAAAAMQGAESMCADVTHCLTQTDCEVDFAPPLDYVEPQPQPKAAPVAAAAAVATKPAAGAKRASTRAWRLR